jgi:nucleotide-binding universal stress UspA family protein
MTNRTVVCWNGSKQADAAAEWALRRAESQGAHAEGNDAEGNTEADGDTVELFDVVDVAQFLGEPMGLKRASSLEEERLSERLYDLADAHPGIQLESHLLAGDPLSLLTEQTRPDTLVVVGTAHRVTPRFTYGWSLGARLATAAAGPVAIVPLEEAAVSQGRSGVTVGIDGSDIGRLALQYAATEAARLGQRLKVVHCWQEPLADDPVVVPSQDFVAYHETVHRELLDHHVRIVAAAHPELHVVPVLLRKNPVAGLRSESADEYMLVVGSRRLDGWRRAWLGSVSHGLVLTLRAPTVVVGAETKAGV